MEIDRKTNLILKHGDIYLADPNYNTEDAGQALSETSDQALTDAQMEGSEQGEGTQLDS